MMTELLFLVELFHQTCTTETKNKQDLCLSIVPEGKCHKTETANLDPILI